MRGPLPDEERELTETTTHRTYVELLRNRLTWLEDLRTVSGGAATSATATVQVSPRSWDVGSASCKMREIFSMRPRVTV